MVVRLKHGKKRDLTDFTYPALGRSFSLTGVAAGLRKASKLTVPDKIPYLLQGQPATVSKLPPVWGAAQTFNVTQGVASGPTALNVSVPGGGSPTITVAWHSSSVPSTNPSWITLTSGTAPTISFTTGSLDNEDVSSMVISATANGSAPVLSSAGSVTVTSGEPSWTTVPNITLRPASPTHDYSQYVTNWSGAAHAMQLYSGSQPLPANLSLASNGVVTYNGNTNYATTSGLVFEVVDNAQADWASRSAGAMYAENWASYATAADYYNHLNVGDMVGHLSNKNPSQGATWTNAFEMVSDTARAKTGKAFRLYLGKNNFQAAGTIDYQGFFIPFNGDPYDVPGAYRTEFYLQLSVWVDEFVDYYWRQSNGSVQSCKFLRLDDPSGTNTGEIVINNQNNQGFVTAYRRNSNGNPLFDRLQVTQLYTNYAHQPAINNASPASPSTEAQYKQKYGPMNYGMSNGTSQASLLHLQANTPDPNAVIGGVPWNRGGITVLEIYANFNTQTVKVWAAPHGSAPRLIVNEVGTANLGSRVRPDGTGWAAIELSNLPYTSDGANNPNYPLSWIDYSELIVSENPIPFPLQPGVALP